MATLKLTPKNVLTLVFLMCFGIAGYMLKQPTTREYYSDVISSNVDQIAMALCATLSLPDDASRTGVTTTTTTTTTPKALPAPPPCADDLPTIYVITPTYTRMEQLPDMTRLSQTLMLVPKVVWIVVEDSKNYTIPVADLLSRFRSPYVHLVAEMPIKYKEKKAKPKGVANRMAGLEWIRKNGNDNGVIYFADDDNSYDLRLFEEMRSTKKVAMWPVGLVTALGVSTPVIKDGKVIDFYDGWKVNRKFPVDMAGFAVNVKFLKSKPEAKMPFLSGYEEDGFLKSLEISNEDIEPKADNCKLILVWHTKTKSNPIPKKMSAENKEKFAGTNLMELPYII